MNEKEAKELCKQPLGKGSITGNEPWVIQQSLVTACTAPVTTLIMNCKGIVATDYFIKTTCSDNDKKKSAKNVAVFQDFAPSSSDCKSRTNKDKDGSSEEEIANKKTKDILVTKDMEGNVLRVLKAITRGKDTGAIYIYTASPAFEGQEPNKDEKVEGVADTPALYVFGRIRVVKKGESSSSSSSSSGGGTAAFAILSYCKGLDADNESGYAWKDIYKAIRKPQFQFASIVLDMNDNIVCKAQQQNMLRADIIVHQVAPGVDMLALAAVCHPLLPDGSQFSDAVESLVEDIASFFE